MYVSTGPAIVEAEMPNVVGYDIKWAEDMLKGLGFENREIEKVINVKPAGEVVRQSHKPGTLMDVNTKITLYVSVGPQEPPPGTLPPEETEPAETVPGEITMDFTFSLPQNDNGYKLNICLTGSNEVLINKYISPGVTSTMVTLTGRGEVSYDLYIDGEFERTQKVEFKDD